MVATGQVGVLATICWLLLTQESDATATTVHWESVSFTLITPFVLALSAWIGHRAQRRSAGGPAVVRAVASTVQRLTVVIMLLALGTAPPMILGAVFFDPMG